MEEKKIDEPYIAYREEEDLWELFIPETNTSYWLDLEEPINDICLKRVTKY